MTTHNAGSPAEYHQESECETCRANWKKLIETPRKSALDLCNICDSPIEVPNDAGYCSDCEATKPSGPDYEEAHSISFGLYPAAKAQAECSCGWKSSKLYNRDAERAAANHLSMLEMDLEALQASLPQPKPGYLEDWIKEISERSGR